MSAPIAAKAVGALKTLLDGLSSGAASIPAQLTAAQTAASQATAAASAPALAIQPNIATPTIPPTGVTSGSQYWAAVSDGLQLYLNTSGTGAPVSATVIQYGKSFVDSIVGRVSASPLKTPVVVDSAGSVPLWLEAGSLNFRALAPSALAKIGPGIGISTFPSVVGRTPLITDGGNVAVWLENGNLEARGIGSRLLSRIAASVTVDPTAILASAKTAGDIAYAPRNAVYGATTPTHTDGRNLRRWYRKLAGFRQTGGTGKLKVMLFGDSYHEQVALAQATADILYGQLGAGGGGWISVNATAATGPSSNRPIDSATFARANWTYYDGSAGVPATPPAFGCSHDGMAISTTGTTATATFVTGPCTDISLFYPKVAGSFRWRLDGGAWTTITGDGSNTLATIPGLTGLPLQAHTLEIDTTPNTGAATVAIFGLYFTTPAQNGVEVIKAGNGGLRAAGMMGYLTNYVPPIISQINPDLIIVSSWGTNDARLYNDVALFRSTLQPMVDALRTAAPDCSIIICTPPDLNDTMLMPITTIRDEIMKFCLSSASGVECSNIHDLFGTWATENAAGQFFDELHLNDIGAYRSRAATISQFVLPSSYRKVSA